MLIWGGVNNGFSQTMQERPLNTGGRYTPDSDSWTAISQGTSCPTPRTGHTAVWTGTEMLVWGGLDFSSGGVFLRQNTGAKYLPASDSWTPMSLGAANLDNAGAEGRLDRHRSTSFPRAARTGGREDHGHRCGVGCGHEHLAPYGAQLGNPRSKVGPGRPSGRGPRWSYGVERIYLRPTALFPPGREGGTTRQQDKWSPTYAGPGTPDPRSGHSAIWTGTRMIIWGGTGQWNRVLNSGSSYDPAANRWNPLSTGGECPIARGNPSAIWTGKDMIIWGGSQPVSGQSYARSETGGCTTPPRTGGGPFRPATAPLRHAVPTPSSGPATPCWFGGRARIPSNPQARGHSISRRRASGSPWHRAARVRWRLSQSRVLGRLAPFRPWSIHSLRLGGHGGALDDPDEDTWETAAESEQMPWLRSIFTGATAGQQVLLYQSYDIAGWLYRPCLEREGDHPPRHRRRRVRRVLRGNSRRGRPALYL